MITDMNNAAASNMASSDIAVMWDSVSTKPLLFNHVSNGGNVLFMDGHVAFFQYKGDFGSKFPVNKGGAIISAMSFLEPTP